MYFVTKNRLLFDSLLKVFLRNTRTLVALLKFPCVRYVH